MKKHSLEVKAEQRDAATCVYRLSGVLYGTVEAYAFQEQTRQKVSEGVRKIVLDLGAVERIDSSGIGILVTVAFSTHRAGGAIVLASVPPRVRDTLSIALLLDRIETADSVDEALGRLDRVHLPPGPR